MADAQHFNARGDAGDDVPVTLSAEPVRAYVIDAKMSIDDQVEAQVGADPDRASDVRAFVDSQGGHSATKPPQLSSHLNFDKEHPVLLSNGDYQFKVTGLDLTVTGGIVTFLGEDADLSSSRPEHYTYDLPGLRFQSGGSPRKHEPYHVGDDLRMIDTGFRALFEGSLAVRPYAGTKREQLPAQTFKPPVLPNFLTISGATSLQDAVEKAQVQRGRFDLQFAPYLNQVLGTYTNVAEHGPLYWQPEGGVVYDTVPGTGNKVLRPLPVFSFDPNKAGP